MDPGVTQAITAFIMLGSLVAIVALTMHFRTQRAQIEAMGGGEYRALAEEAVRAQRALHEEMLRMNETLKEIERILKEV